MDELVGLIVEQLSKAARDARQRQAAASSAIPAPGPPKAVAVLKAPPAPKAAPAMPVAPRPAAVPKRPSQQSPPPDPFAVVASPTVAPSPNPLLAAFAGSNGLLAGIVLGEALAPPLALRERTPGHS